MTDTTNIVAGRDQVRRRFLALLALAALLRLPGLNQGFWFDEIMAVVMFFPAPWSKLLTEMPIANHHPLYSLIGKLMFMAAGPQEWALRLPAFVFGALTPPVLYLAGRKISERAGVLAALFMSGGMWPVWFSQDARGYSLMILLCLISAALFLSACERPTRANLIGCAACGALAMYTHLFAGAVVGAELLVAAGRLGRRRDWRPLAAAAAALVAAFLLYLPLLSDLALYTATQGTITNGREMSAGFLWTMLTTFSAGRLPAALGLGFLAPAAAGYALAWRRPLLPLLFTLSLLIGVAMPTVLHTFVFHRFFAYALPGAYLFAALSVDELFQRGRPRLAAGLAVVIAVTILLPLGDYYRKGKQSFRPAADWIAANAPGYRPIAVGLGRQVYGYYDRSARGRATEELTAANIGGSAVVVSHPWSVTVREHDLLTRNCGLAQSFPSAGYREYDVDVYLCPPPGR